LNAGQIALKKPIERVHGAGKLARCDCRENDRFLGLCTINLEWGIESIRPAAIEVGRDIPIRDSPIP